MANHTREIGGEVKVEKHEARALCYDPIEYIKEDLKIQEPGGGGPGGGPW